MSKQRTNRDPGTRNTYFDRRKSDLKDAYDIGFAKGWDDAYTIPKRVGARYKAAKGYSRGIRSRTIVDKYMTQYNRGKQKIKF